MGKIAIGLTTYNRTGMALKTISAIKENLKADFFFLVYDDGSDGNHRSVVREAAQPLDLYNGERRGVGHGMNWILRRSLELGSDLVMILEDDWELTRPLNLDTHIRLLENQDVGMVRFGYLSIGLTGEVIAAEGHLWLSFIRNGYQYVYAGHPSLRSVNKLHERVGFFSEGLSPKQNELNFCAKYNAAINPPAIVWDMNYGHMGPFAHIGNESIGDISPSEG